ncbi:MAG: ABC transporter permease subunit [Candidatus Woesearchaeota archaeon]|jgi:microcin C transport system permease protein|nr:ABC transporter permease subunit [Candidatus Woesearchaeota archaeon]
MENKKIQIPESLLKKRWKKFKKLKRAYYSLILIVTLYLLSFFNPLLVNNKALVVKYEGVYHFPAFGGYYSVEKFNQTGFGEAKYRQLAKRFENEKDGENWLIMPPYPYSPIENLLDELEEEPPVAPGGNHILGTDNRGRDIFARLVYGFNISISFALVITLFSYIIGILVGAVLGYFGGKVDLIGVRFMEILSGIPFLYAIMIITSVFQPSFLLLVVLIIVIRGWKGQTYYIRGEFLREKPKDYVAAAVSMGGSRFRVMFRHILPNSLTPIITFAPFTIVGYIFSLVSLDYLGFGLQPPTPSWGELMSQGISDIHSWWLIAAPLGAMFFTLLIINFVGEGAREAFDPRDHSRLR